ncbi:MAG: LamG-like jellyroll fold domain-containing protein, partial [Pirellulales bacterium]
MRRRLGSESLESRHLLAAVSLWDALDQSPVEAISVSASTGEKPQSKVWEHGGDWWSVLPDNSGTWLRRLEGDVWNSVVQLSGDTGTQADVKVVGNLAHVLMFQGTSSEFVTLEYGPSGYGFWSAQPQVVDMVLGSGVETATIDVDSTGRLWVAYDRSSTIEVRYSDGLYTSFSAPITVASGITSDDICSIIAMPGGTVGVFWSNQNSKRFGFRTHVDGTNPNTWTADEVPASQSAQSKGKGFADDHLHLAVSANGTLYAAVKTSYDSSGYPSIALLVRRPNGIWDNVYTVDTSGTRPVVVISEAHNQLAVLYTEDTGGGDIVMRASALDQIDLGPVQVVLSGSFNDVTTSKANVGDELLVMAKKSGSAYGSLIQIGVSGAQPNAAPLVNAGVDQSITLPSGANLSGAVSDDGQPTGTLLATWSVVSGPGAVNFTNANSATTFATFSQAGTYVLRLTASDGSLQSSDLVTIQVAASVQQNQAPTVNAGADQSIALPGSANLSGSASDDGQPSGTLSTTWTKVSGPGIVTFANASATSTTVTFSQAGTYILQLTANDGSLQSSDQLTILVAEDLVASPQAGASDPTLVGSWSLNGNGNDQSGQGNNGSTAGSTSYVAGKNDQALSISGDGRLVVPDDSSLDISSAITLSAWIRPSAKGTQYFLTKKGKSSTDGFELSLSNSGTIFVRFNETSNDDAYRVDSTSKYSTNGQTWIHVTATYDGSTIKLYINGQLQGSKNANFQIATNNLPLSIGSGQDGYRGMKGAVDDARVYSRALTASEVTALMTNAPPAPPQNAAPTVSAGVDKTITLPNTVSLIGSAGDDGQPSGTLITTWTKVSGPGTVTFANANVTATNATFSQTGTYVLRLTANDGSLQASDDVVIQVNAAAPLNAVPTVNAGADLAITLPGNVTLSGSASDDGQPSGTLNTTWTKVSGPGTVNFANANSTSTTATFSQTGTYVLRLTANDGSLQA